MGDLKRQGEREGEREGWREKEREGERRRDRETERENMCVFNILNSFYPKITVAVRYGTSPWDCTFSSSGLGEKMAFSKEDLCQALPSPSMHV